MTDTIEQKALALVNEVRAGYGYTVPITYKWFNADSFEHLAFLRAIEQHEAFRQEVSDEIAKLGCWPDTVDLGRFIIAKPDPLVEVLDEALWEVCNVKLTDRELQAVLLRLNAKRGGKIVWGEG